MATIIQNKNNYAFRVDQVAWIRLRKADPGSTIDHERMARVEFTLIGNSAKSIVCIESYEEAEKYFNTIVSKMSEI